MGGHGSGGNRPGSGTKPDEAVDSTPLPEVAIPDDLTSEVREVWVRLAPLARQRRTLTDATVERFRRLCQAIVLADKMQAKVVAEDFETTKVTLQMDAAGGGLQNVEKKKHHLLTELRGWYQHIASGLADFRLTATGRPMASPATKPKSPLEQLQAERLRAVK